MIDEVLYMEMRLFSEFCKRTALSPKEANQLFNRFQIWEYIESCYETLHTEGDELILDDIKLFLNKNGAAV